MFVLLASFVLYFLFFSESGVCVCVQNNDHSNCVRAAWAQSHIAMTAVSADVSGQGWETGHT